MSNTFIERCKDENRFQLQIRKILINYIRDINHQPQGCIIFFKKDGQLYTGWSKCHSKLDNFCKAIALNISLKRSGFAYQDNYFNPRNRLINYCDLHPTVANYYPIAYKRAIKYFGLEN